MLSSEPTFSCDVPPAGDPGVGAAEEGAGRGCQAHGSDVVVEGDRRGELQEADVVVVVVGVGSVVRVNYDLCNRPRHLVRVGAFLILATQIHKQVGCVGTGELKKIYISKLIS